MKFQKLNQTLPYIKLNKFYKAALHSNQPAIDAILIASFCKKNNEVDARYVNLKIINDEQFIFFSNYNSPKSTQFSSHDQISAVLYWSTIDVQIRMKAKIEKVTDKFSDEYFKTRDINKNALAISSHQSEPIDSYELVSKSFNETVLNQDLLVRPDFWGGFSFTPYYFEFWEGHESRLNKRNAYEMNNNTWEHSTLQP